MTAHETFIIAGLTLRLNVEGFPIALPASFAPFRSDSREAAGLTVSLGTSPQAAPSDAVVTDDTTSDMGRVRLLRAGQAWIVTLTDRTGATHTLTADLLFSHADLQAEASSAEATAAVSSLLRIAFSQRIIMCDGLSVHASAVVAPDGSGYIFLGPSGTGKSTHSRLWAETFPGTRLLNDDNPVVTVGADGRATVHGSPWSGKTPCYTNCCAPLRGIVRLQQNSQNSFTLLHDVKAFAAIIPSCSTIRSYPQLHERLCDTVALLATGTPTAIMQCRPDRDAAIVCADALQSISVTPGTPAI